MKLHPRMSLLAGTAGLLMAPTVFSQQFVADDLITQSNQTTPWLACTTDSPAVDVTSLDAGGCRYRTTPATAGTTYKMSCGVTVVKYASITLAFLDANEDTLATRTTEVNDHVSGGYSVTLDAPANTAFAAIGIYGEPGSGFQDCVLVDATPEPEPTKGSIGGISWFDGNSDNTFDANESGIGNTSVKLFQGENLLAQSETDTDGRYYFGNLDVDACYTVNFAAADATLRLGSVGGQNNAQSNGSTSAVCLTETVPNVPDVDAAFVAVPPPVPPADNAICGVAWVDANANGQFDNGDSTLPNVTAKLMNASGEQIDTFNTTESGNYVFSDLVNGAYSVMFVTPDGHEPTTQAGSPNAGTSYINAQGMTPGFSLPGDKNTSEESSCTIQNVNAGYAPLPVALEPTVANNDKVSTRVGSTYIIDFLENDMACGESVSEVDILGHNVPGKVSFNSSTQRIVISNTTRAGDFSIQYGIRGDCGSYDTASIKVELTEVPPPPVASAPDAPMCRIETGGDYTGGVDVFNSSENGFASSYNLYDRNKQLVTTVSGSDYTHRIFIPQSTARGEVPYIGNWETEWGGTKYDFDQVSIHFISAIENGTESSLTQCDRTFISPIAIDLENEGRISRIAGNFSADIDNDGLEDKLKEWFTPNVGILVTADAHGKISGEYLFGNETGKFENGFEELATLDVNGDRKLTENELDVLALWFDRNSNTIVDAGEIMSLEEHDIKALEVDHYKFMARATKSDGKQILMEDVWLTAFPIITSEVR